MASFSLRSQRTGLFKEFSLLEVLKLLGDKVNDEIWLEDNEDVFNLSSFIELNGSNNNGNGQSIQWLHEAPVNINGLSLFTLQSQPHNSIVLVFLNGLSQKAQLDFTIQNKTVQFPFALTLQDNLIFFYQSLL